MTIHLHTGVPGTGKSLHVVDAIEHRPEYKDRPLYAHAVDGWKRAVQIRCAHPGCRTCRDLTSEQRAGMYAVEQWQDWAEAGALIVVDEAHYPFPQRRERECPLYIQRLTEHRHDGLDFWLCTPNANLLDINVRRLVERHEHFVKGVTGRFRITHTECMESDERLKLGVKERVILPTRSYKFYKSADMHVKLHSKMPRVVWWLAALVVLAVGALFWSTREAQNLRYSVVPAAEAAAVEDLGLSEDPPRPLQSFSSAPTFIAGPAGPGAFSPVDPRGRVGVVAGCMGTEDRCRCYDDKAFPVVVSPLACRAALRRQWNPRLFVERDGVFDLPVP